MSEFIEIIFDFPKETKSLAPSYDGGCFQCAAKPWCDLRDPRKCGWVEGTTCVNTEISVCLECEKRTNDILDTIIKNKGC